ncbi:MAG: adenine deaminase [Desulfobacterales bacterium GWB2_56_26]|nr:MAG: adenine deaminase [Desulfobacterales bacterium GWB2_56_26]
MDTRFMVDVAMGRKPADLVIKNGLWVCVQTSELIPATDLAVSQGRIAFIGASAAHIIGTETLVIDAAGRYLVPGLLDAHMHVESGMLTLTEFVRAVVLHGTTGMFIDPHEIANVFGLPGVKLMVDEAAGQPIHVWVQIPSCVPSAPGLETPGATIGPTEVAEAMHWPGIIGLGEMMDFPGVFMSGEQPHLEMLTTRTAGKVIGGHYASLDLGLPFHGYAAGGPEDDHEGTRLEDAIARARQGMKVMLRYGSAWHDVAEQVKAVTERGLDARHFLLCTDDSHAATLVEEGHMDRTVRHAIAEGVPPMQVLQMATINTAVHFGVSREVGMLAPGRFADILLVDDLQDFRARTVIAKGEILSKDGRLCLELPHHPQPAWVTGSVHLPRKVTAEDFVIKAPGPEREGLARVNVIGIIENQAPTRHLKLLLPVTAGEIRSSLAANHPSDVAKVAVIDRHHATGRVQVGLVSGFRFTEKCGVASTVAHDCHHLLVVGTDEQCMALAVGRLAETGGGQVVVRDGEIVGEVQLPVAGLMSDEPAEIVARKTASVLNGFRGCGCTLQNPNMQLSLLALVVIPELRISDLGLIDVVKRQCIPVVERMDG